jgi:hypothetical protein
MPGTRGSALSRRHGVAPVNGHAVTKKGSQRFEQIATGRRESLCDEEEVLVRGLSSASSSSVSLVASPPRIVLPEFDGPGTATESTGQVSSYANVLPPHQYLDSLAIVFLLINVPDVVLLLVQGLFMLRVTPISIRDGRHPSWKVIIGVEALLILFYAVITPSIRAGIATLAEPVIASTLAGNGGRGTAICASFVFIANGLPTLFIGGSISWKPSSSNITNIVSAAKSKNGASDRLDGRTENWNSLRQIIALHVVARWTWETLKRFLTIQVKQSKLENAEATPQNVSTATIAKWRKANESPPAPRMVLWTTLASHYISSQKRDQLSATENHESYLAQLEGAFHVREVTTSSVRLCVKRRKDLLSSFGELDAFEVRVNGLLWREVSASLEENTDMKNHSLYQDRLTCLFLDITSLVSSTNEIEVTNTTLDSDTILFHAAICTMQSEATPITASTVRQNSPISTLTEKVKSSTEHLEVLKSTLKRIRKDHKSSLATLRNEHDAMLKRLQAPDKAEERARRGNLALKTHIKQIEEKIASSEQEMCNIKQGIAARTSELDSCRRKWEFECAVLDRNHEKQSQKKLAMERILQEFHEEKLAIQARKERLTARDGKLKAEWQLCEDIVRKRHECDELQRRRQDSRVQLIRERQAMQAEQVLHAEQQETQVLETMDRISKMHCDRLALEKLPVHPGEAPL